MQASTPPPRLWRAAARRNVRNSWSTMKSQCSTWSLSSSLSLSSATALINAHLSHRYMGSLDLGVLTDMDGICDKARTKLFLQQETHLHKLLENFWNMVHVVSLMVTASVSMRTYLKGAMGGPLIEFSNVQKVPGDTGDGGGIAVFSTLSLATLEILADEIVTMYRSELRIKWRLVSEFYAIVYPGINIREMHLSKMEQYINLLEEPFAEKHNMKNTLLASKQHEVVTVGENKQKCQWNREVLEVYLTAWLAEVKINKVRIDEILKIVSQEMEIDI